MKVGSLINCTAPLLVSHASRNCYMQHDCLLITTRRDIPENLKSRLHANSIVRQLLVFTSMRSSKSRLYPARLDTLQTSRSTFYFRKNFILLNSRASFYHAWLMTSYLELTVISLITFRVNFKSLYCALKYQFFPPVNFVTFLIDPHLSTETMYHVIRNILITVYFLFTDNLLYRQIILVAKWGRSGEEGRNGRRFLYSSDRKHLLNINWHGNRTPG
jgi:hypothetical protein